MISESSAYNRLSKRSVTAWRLNNGLWSLLAWVPPVYFAVAAWYGVSVPLWVTLASTGLAIFLTVLLLWVLPKIRWRQWRYRVDEHEIDLHHGIWFTRQTLVPVKRVQHVDTRQGPILRSYDLADIVISTAATTHKIPALTAERADHVRSEISAYARKAKDDRNDV